jgi:putative alpha-1,2-mannosidase
VWATLGLFPVAGQNLFLVNAPAWRESRIKVGESAMTIETTGFVEPEPSGPAQYVQSVHLNGAPLERSWLTGTELHRGGRLLIELGPVPGRWGTEVRPPSTSTSEASRTEPTGGKP